MTVSVFDWIIFSMICYGVFKFAFVMIIYKLWEENKILKNTKYKKFLKFIKRGVGSAFFDLLFALLAVLINGVLDWWTPFLSEIFEFVMTIKIITIGGLFTIYYINFLKLLVKMGA